MRICDHKQNRMADLPVDAYMEKRITALVPPPVQTQYGIRKLPQEEGRGNFKLAEISGHYSDLER